MEPADVHTLTGAYAADALDDLERAAFERHLGACPDCTEEVRGLRETVARLADGVAVPPPSAVRERVLAQIAVTAQVPPPGSSAAAGPGAGTGADPAPAGRRAARRGPWLAAAATLLAVSTVTGSLAWTQYRSAEEARDLAGRVAAVVADPRARRVSATVEGGGDVTVVVAERRAVVVTAAMPGLPEDRLYQLWIVRPQAVVPAGLGPAADQAAGSWARLVDGVRPGDTVAVSVEPLGGSAQPTTTPMVTLRV
jgi:anti-sigma-K factor RskA